MLRRAHPLRQGWSGHIAHNHLNKPKVVQSDGVDDVLRVKTEQQRWLDHEQFAGYSDSYLKMHMRYTPQYEFYQARAMTGPQKHFQEMTEIIYDVYGEAADLLEQLEADPLHPQFAQLLAQAKAKRGELERKLDEIYAGAHPTVKTMYDSMLVRRWLTLDDWAELVARKRKSTLERLSPEYLAEMERQRGVAESHMSRLRHLGAAMEASPVAFLEGSGFTDEELVMIERRKRFFSRQREIGRNVSAGDYSPH